MRPLLVVLSLAASLLALPAAAGLVIKPHGFFYDAPNLGPFADAQGFTVVGGGLEVGLGCGPWGWYLGAGLGAGGHEFTDVAGSTETTRLRAHHFRAGADYHVAIGSADLYGGPAVFWSSSTRGHESPFEPFHELEPFTFFGFEPRAGGAVPLGPKWLKAYGEFSLMVGRARIEDDHAIVGVVAAWKTSAAFRGGFAIAP